MFAAIGNLFKLQECQCRKDLLFLQMLCNIVYNNDSTKELIMVHVLSRTQLLKLDLDYCQVFENELWALDRENNFLLSGFFKNNQSWIRLQSNLEVNEVLPEVK